jgi:hypothetical protein
MSRDPEPELVKVRFTAADAALVARMARRADLPPADFIRFKVLDRLPTGGWVP